MEVMEMKHCCCCKGHPEPKERSAQTRLEQLDRGRAAMRDRGIPVTLTGGRTLNHQGPWDMVLYHLGPDWNYINDRGDARIIVRGDVPAGCLVAAFGGGAQILVSGRVHPTARVAAQGASAQVILAHPAPSGTCTAVGGGAQVLVMDEEEEA